MQHLALLTDLTPNNLEVTLNWGCKTRAFSDPLNKDEERTLLV